MSSTLYFVLCLAFQLTWISGSPMATTVRPSASGGDSESAGVSQLIGSSQALGGSFQTNECLNDSLGGCSSSSPRVYTYDTDVRSLGSRPISIDLGRDYNFDRLSELDQAILKIKDSDIWVAADQESLRQVLILHRHGDRTPISFEAKDSLASEPFWRFHGLGQLTNRGKARLHLLGELMRKRYEKFFAGSVNKNFRKSRASGALRCIESAQVFLSSFLALDVQNSPDARYLVWDQGQANPLAHLWQPSSVSTLAAKYDGMLNEGAQCKALDKEYAALDETEEFKRVQEEYKEEADVLRQEMGMVMDHFYKWFWAGSVLEVERSYFPSKVKPELLKVYDRVAQAADLTLGLYQSGLKAKRLRAGLLVDDMLVNMSNMRKLVDKQRSGASSSGSGGQLDPTFVKKLVHYSGHDLNLVVLLGMLDQWKNYPSRPDYASNIVLELHQDQEEWFVRLFYMAHVPTRPQELHMEECEAGHPLGRCTLDRFESLMEPYRIDSWQAWMSECQNNLSRVDPYAANT